MAQFDTRVIDTLHGTGIVYCVERYCVMKHDTAPHARMRGNAHYQTVTGQSVDHEFIQPIPRFQLHVVATKGHLPSTD